MGLLQAGYRTYETQSHRIGIAKEGEREPLTPLSHMIQNAQIEITISDDGVFQSAIPIPKEDNKTIIPITEKSASRTNKPYPHPLCEQVFYLAPYGGDKYIEYLKQLEQWATSPFSHPKVRAVWQYIRGGTLLSDLSGCGLITLSDDGTPGAGKIANTEYDKCLVRWRVIPSPQGVSSASWQDQSLFDSYAGFRQQQCAARNRDICMITGQEDTVCELHPKGVDPFNFGAKLISANDSHGYTYRGRFVNERQAYSIGYTASQKAHNALRWVAANQGVTIGGRTFLCWNPEGYCVPQFDFLGHFEEKPADSASYQDALSKALCGYDQSLPDQADVVIAALDAATPGRLSVTYYNELKGSDFLNRLKYWYATICWPYPFSGIQPTSIRRIVRCAFGTQRGNRLELDDKLLREHTQRLMHCMIDQKPLPQDIVKALVTRASTPLAYDTNNRMAVMAAACAVIRKSYIDREMDQTKREEWTLELHSSKNNPELMNDRSFLFGQLLAIADVAERSTYRQGEERVSNAIRIQSIFAQRPMNAWRNLYHKLIPYFKRMKPGLLRYYQDMIRDIENALACSGLSEQELNKPLKDLYLLGQGYQYNALYSKKETTTEVNENEQTAQ